MSRQRTLNSPVTRNLTTGLLLLVLTVAPVLAGERNGEVAAAGYLLDLWNEQQLAHRNVPGLTIAVVHDQEVVWSNSYGWADLESQRPMTSSTPFRIGSVTKVFTATAVMQLRDAGKLQLDDPVPAHLPWFSVVSAADDPPITIRHLLTHTAGLTREAPFPYWTDHVFPDREQLISALAEQQAVYPPGTQYKYSNLGMALLGEIVATVSGQSWEEYVEEHIFEPLRMDDSDTAAAGDVLDALATGYMRLREDGSRGIFDYYETYAMAPADHIVSTLPDLVEFARFQFRDEPLGEASVLAGSSLREMHQVHWVYPSWSGGRGLGFGVSRRGGKTVVSHGGWIAGNRCHLMLVPDEKIAVVALVNADDGQPYVFSYEAYDMLAPVLLSAAEGVGDQTADGSDVPDAWRSYYGLYSDPWEWEYRVFALNGELVLYDYSYPPSDSARSGVTVLEPVGEHSFLMPDGEPVVFEFDDHGRVFRIKRRFDYLHRLDEAVEPAVGN